MRVCKRDAHTRVEIGYELIVSNTDEVQAQRSTVRQWWMLLQERSPEKFNDGDCMRTQRIKYR